MAKLKENSTILKSTGEEIIATEESVDRKLLLKADKDYVDTQLATKVDKVAGKGLSTNDYTNEEKQKNQDNADKISDLQQELETHKAQTATNAHLAENIGLMSLSFEADNVEDGMDELKDEIDSKESPSGAQAKADRALNAAKKYTDEEVGKIADDLDAHKAQKATQDTLGHIKLQDIPVKSVNSKTGEVVIDVGDIAGLVGTKLGLGLNASVTGISSVALGYYASAGNHAVALGRSASAAGNYSVALGGYTSAETSAVALGYNASAAGNYSVALGYKASAESSSVALGENSSAAGSGSVALGVGALAAMSASVALGANASAEGIHSVAIGRDAWAADNAVALGIEPSAEGLHSVALGVYAWAENNDEGVLGSDVPYSTSTWIVPGDFTVSGTKNFEIPHPKPEKKTTHVIRHGAVESPTPGDTLYRWKIQATKDNDIVTIDLPDYFIYLNKDVQVFVTPQGHFGNGYGTLNRETEQLEIHCQFAGEYNVLVIGTRNDDHPSVQEWYIKGVEREIGESWTGETYAFSVDEILEVEEIKEVSV